MKIDGDYLWDRTGEPDPEIQQLEEILGTLRYQPRPLEIPAGLRMDRERNFFRRATPRLAIAATIAMLLLGLGLWLGLRRLQRNQPLRIVKTSDAPQVKPNSGTASSPNIDQSRVASSSGTNQKRIDEPRRHLVNQLLAAGNINRNGSRNAAVKHEQLAAQQQQEAEAAKDQLMLAFRVASAKLNFAQRKTQTTYPRDLIHNQHRIG
jgi:hypothetical protein